MASPRPVPGLDAREPFEAAAARIVTVRADELWTMAERARRETSAAAVHDLRVASRRLRAALEVFAACFPGKRHRAVTRDVKRLAAELGIRRDADVLLEAVVPLRDGAGREDRPGLRAFALALERERDEGSARVAAALAAVAESDLPARIGELVRSATG